jgi:hypothetical protein
MDISEIALLATWPLPKHRNRRPVRSPNIQWQSLVPDRLPFATSDTLVEAIHAWFSGGVPVHALRIKCPWVNCENGKSVGNSGASNAEKTTEEGPTALASTLGISTHVRFPRLSGLSHCLMQFRRDSSRRGGINKKRGVSVHSQFAPLVCSLKI